MFSALKHYPLIFIPLSRLLIRMGMFRRDIVSGRTELVIEGFPRSANSFAVNAFILSQPRPVVLAHHTHAPAQVVWAARRGIPTLVLARRPEDAVLSSVIYSPALSIRQSLKDYIRFYTKIKPFQGSYVVATFDEVTNNFGEVIERINLRFGTEFSPFEHTKENAREIFKLLDRRHLLNTGRSEVTETKVARPSREREGIKKILQTEFESEDLKDLVARAEVLFRDFTAQPS